MSVPMDNTITVQVYNKISKHKDQDMQIDKIRHLKTTTTGMLKKGQITTLSNT